MRIFSDSYRLSLSHAAFLDPGYGDISTSYARITSCECILTCFSAAMVMDLSVSCFSCIALYRLFYTVYVEAINEYEMHNLDASFGTPLHSLKCLQSRHHSVVISPQSRARLLGTQTLRSCVEHECTVVSHAAVVEMTSRRETLRPTSFSATARTSC